MKLLLPTENLPYDADLIAEIDRDMKTIYRLLVFDDRFHSSGLMGRYQEAVQHLREVLSIKNAQQEAHTFEEAQAYLVRLKEGMALITEEIREHRSLSGPVDIFRLFRAIAPEAATRHANDYRRTLVVVGGYYAPEPERVAGLMEQLFLNLPQIEHPVIRSAYLHHEFVRIHPFVDGNGRVGRMAKNWLLMYELFPPVFIYGGSDHARYIRGLEASFAALEEDGLTANEATHSFFRDELYRTRASIQFILHRMLREQQAPFGPEDDDITPFPARVRE